MNTFYLLSFTAGGSAGSGSSRVRAALGQAEVHKFLVGLFAGQAWAVPASLGINGSVRGTYVCIQVKELAFLRWLREDSQTLSQPLVLPPV